MLMLTKTYTSSVSDHRLNSIHIYIITTIINELKYITLSKCFIINFFIIVVFLLILLAAKPLHPLLINAQQTLIRFCVF